MKLYYDEPMSLHTTLRVGGPADRYIIAETEEELREAVAGCRREGLPFAVIGRGSNLLFSDRGYRGTVIAFRVAASALSAGEPADPGRSGDTQAASGQTDTPGIRIVEESADGASVFAAGGVTLGALASFAMERGLAGLAFAGGIPGTVGGGIRMNAGAYGGELSDVTAGVRVLAPDGSIRERSASDMDFGYRHSAVQESGEIVLGATFLLAAGDPREIADRMAELMRKRREKQPLEYPSAGSTWKRPEGHFAAKLIEEAGCKGLSVGDARISEKHAGFLINGGHATAADIRALMRMVEERVLRNSGVQLKPEIELLGFDDGE